MLNRPVLIIISKKTKVNSTIFSPDTFWEYNIKAKNTNIKKAINNPNPPKTASISPPVPKIKLNIPDIFKHLL